MSLEPVACHPDMDLASAVRLMLESRVGSLPVVTAQHVVSGMLTDRDVAIAAGTSNRPAREIAVHEAMSGHVRGCQPHEDLHTALGLMARARVRRLPVTDASGHLLGILSIDDILRRAVDEGEGIAPADVLRAMRTICEGPGVEPKRAAASGSSQEV